MAAGRVTLQPLSAYEGPPYRPKRMAIGALFGVAVAFAGAMFLPWVGVVSVTGAYEKADGIERANWLLLIAVIIVLVAVRLVREPPGGFIRFVLVAIDFFVTLGMYIEYIDNLGRAESLTVPPYLGPGFFIALGGTAVLITASVLAWRARDD
jgi:hypothetical protein